LDQKGEFDTSSSYLQRQRIGRKSNAKFIQAVPLSSLRPMSAMRAQVAAFTKRLESPALTGTIMFYCR